tara:strand:+ start:279 stop:1088 length:810 start_codon:yes stop_codon:yes gene_type:complete
MKISSGGIGTVASAISYSGATSAGAGAVDKYLWTWDAVGQHLGNSTYSFTSTAADDNWIGTGIVFTANDDGVHMAHDETFSVDMHGNPTGNTPMLWDISEEHLFKQDGTTPTSSGPLDSTVTVDGDQITFIYSHSYLGQDNPGSWFFGLTGSGPATSKFYWTQAVVTSTFGGGEYSSGINLSSVNIEGNDIYLTYRAAGTTADINAESAQLAWEAASSDPRVLEDNPWSGSVSKETHILFRGAIIWNSTTSAKGNTGVTFPIFDDPLSP